MSEHVLASREVEMDAISSEEYRTLVGAVDDGPSEMSAAEFTDLMKSGQVSFISGPEKAAATGEKKKHVKPKTQEKFEAWLDAHCTEDVVREHRGIPNRRFAFDYAVPSVLLAWEYDGLNQPKDKERAAHLSMQAVINDSVKLNLASLNGWLVIRVNAVALNPKSGATGYAHAEAALRQKGVWRE